MYAPSFSPSFPRPSCFFFPTQSEVRMAANLFVIFSRSVRSRTNVRSFLLSFVSSTFLLLLYKSLETLLRFSSSSSFVLSVHVPMYAPSFSLSFPRPSCFFFTSLWKRCCDSLRHLLSFCQVTYRRTLLPSLFRFLDLLASSNSVKGMNCLNI
ncbi:hypothetical protein SAMN05192532_102695 [Alteribacillus iranensis]|uniref:Uncharacterized protein n=1 Tax=Alteribacillus iranensis TaxID=930128 RepID=A0A1I2C4G7_9BACI|nr:hypothetical protein SAMN05192532_102695 [Alteribacillus iranensis]